jgi:hypothetical protein
MESVVRLLGALIVIKYGKCIAFSCRVERLNFNSVTRGWIRDVSDGFYEEASSLAFVRA